MKTVLVHGCWDVLHYGHLLHLREAKKRGDQLIVSVTSDRFVNKGPSRPYFGEQKRAEMLRAFSFVDRVEINDAPTAVPIIERIRPDFYVKGIEYRDFTKDVTGEILNEKKAVEAHGGKLVFTDDETFSSSAIINKHFQPWTDDQKLAIEKVKACGGIEAIERAIENLRGLRVLVVGEPILDIYRFVQPEGISSKSPSISARYLHEEIYRGGSLAIGAHLKDFCKKVTIQHHNHTCEKIRYISGTQRIFEVTKIQDDWWQFHNPEFFIDKVMEQSRNSDVVILADFGHGLFEGPVLKELSRISPGVFVGLNVQTNSSNFGFNVYDKHQRYDYLCLDTREVRLAVNDRWSSPLEIAKRICNEEQVKIGLTVGPNGAYLLEHGRETYSPAFTDNVIDATGAGDAYFSITTSLLKTGCQEDLVPFIGNVFAGLKTKIIGNKSSVSKASLLKACAGILK